MSRSLDAALLLAEQDLVGSEAEARIEPVRWGRLDSLEPVSGCHLTGFPVAERDSQGRPESAQVLGTVAPGSGLVGDHQVLIVKQRPPAAQRATDTPWLGMSGAGVFFQNRLLGLVVRDRKPDSWGNSQFDMVPTAAMFAHRDFVAVVAKNTGETPRLEGVSATEIADAEFERQYAEAIQADYGRIRIFGLRSHSQGRNGWELDTAYLSLEATALDGHALGAGAIAVSAGSQRVEQALRGRQRVLLRGHAGSGKTTLVQWLAVRALAGTLGEELEELNRCVPLVLQLRKLFRRGNLRPRPEEFLELDDRLCADQQPPGWVHRLMTTGRALLLVDGLDEVPDAHRDEALEWLEQLLRHYPRVWTVVTVRPSAVPAGWLNHLGFDELYLAAMSGQDRDEFIKRWHQAALQEALAPDDLPAEAARITRQVEQDRQDLLRTMENSPTLAQLTDSPLLCAMICALNRESSGALPVRRMEIYRDALSLMLVRRDEGRRVQASESVRLSETEQLAMLRRIAHWLVRNNQVEGSHQDAVAQLERALRDLPGAARQGDARQAYRHLLNRSGLITETSMETFQFIHRTFQDYLAAMEFEEERDFGMLAGHAAEEQWGDVIRMTVGHCGRRDRAELLKRILTAADGASDDLRLDILLLVASCLPYAAELGRSVREEVLERCRRHLGDLLLDERRWRQLIDIGEDLVPLIGELALAKGASLNPDAGWHLAFVLGGIGGNEALDLMEELADSDVELLVRGLLCQWRHFDDRQFAVRVLAKTDLSVGQILVTSPSQLAELKALMPLPRVDLAIVDGLDVRDLGFLAESVESLALTGSGRPPDLSFLRTWTRLRTLRLWGSASLADLEPLRDLPISSLWIAGSPDQRPRHRTLEPLCEMPHLFEVALGAQELTEWTLTTAVSAVERVSLYYVAGEPPLGKLLEAFPNVASLQLFPVANSVIDLRGLSGSPGLSVRITVPPEVELVGAELFSSDRLNVVRVS